MSDVSNLIDEVEEALIRAINDSYNRMPTALIDTQPSPEEVRQQAEYDRYAADERQARSQPRNIRGRR